MSIADELKEATRAHQRRIERADSALISLHGVRVDARHEWIDGEIEVIALPVGGVDACGRLTWAQMAR